MATIASATLTTAPGLAVYKATITQAAAETTATIVTGLTGVLACGYNNSTSVLTLTYDSTTGTVTVAGATAEDVWEFWAIGTYE